MPKFKNVSITLSKVSEYPESDFDIAIQDCTHERSLSVISNISRNAFGDYIEFVLSKVKELGHFVLLIPSEYHHLICKRRFVHRYFVHTEFDISIFIISFAPRYDLYSKIKFDRRQPQNKMTLEFIKSVLRTYSHCNKVLDIEPSSKELAKTFFGYGKYDYHFVTNDRKLFATQINLS